MWENVTLLKRGRLITLIITVPCPQCGDLLPLAWTGPPDAREPHFDNGAWCGTCDDLVFLDPPCKQLSRWRELAEMELQKIHREETHRYIYKFSSPSRKKRREGKKFTGGDRARIYGGLLSGNQHRRAV